MAARTFWAAYVTSNPYALWVLVAGFASLAGCGAPSEQQPVLPATPVTSSGVKSPVSINAVMVRVVDHAAHHLWNVEQDGMSPKTDGDWENLEEHATQIATVGTLIRIEGTGVHDRDWVQEPDWQKWAVALSDAGMAAFRAVEARNLPALVAANGQLVDSCESCHKQYKPELPSEGITHSHLH